MTYSELKKIINIIEKTHINISGISGGLLDIIIAEKILEEIRNYKKIVLDTIINNFCKNTKLI